jgi:hypothetical protein
VFQQNEKRKQGVADYPKNLPQMEDAQVPTLLVLDPQCTSKCPAPLLQTTEE